MELNDFVEMSRITLIDILLSVRSEMLNRCDRSFPIKSAIAVRHNQA